MPPCKRVFPGVPSFSSRLPYSVFLDLAVTLLWPFFKLSLFKSLYSFCTSIWPSMIQKGAEKKFQTKCQGKTTPSFRVVSLARVVRFLRTVCESGFQKECHWEKMMFICSRVSQEFQGFGNLTVTYKYLHGNNKLKKSHAAFSIYPFSSKVHTRM